MLLLAIPFSSLITFGVWALDTRYITVSDFQTYQQDQYKRSIADQIDQLTLKEALGMATAYEKALLKQLKEKYNRL